MNSLTRITNILKNLRLSGGQGSQGSQVNNVRLSPFLGGKTPELATTKPKMPLTPYIRYLSRERDLVRKQNPQLKATEIVSLIAQKWRTMSESEKEILQKDYKTDKVAYDEALSLYKTSLAPEQIEAEKQERQKAKVKKTKLKNKNLAKELGKPKRPLTGFMQFVQSTTPPNSLNTLQEVSKNVKEKALHWKAMSDAEKKPFNDRYEAEAKVYHDQLLKWEQKMLTAGNIDIVRSHTVSLLSDVKEKKPRKKAVKKKVKKVALRKE